MEKNEGKINKLPHIFYNTVTDTFDTTWKRNLKSNTGKLRIYKTFKKKIKLETYLLLFENYKHRKELTKLRISAHSLQIEKGRYHRPQKIPIEERFCLHFTAGDVEDEMHFLMICSSLAETRETLITDICTAFPSFRNLPKTDQFLFIVKGDDLDIVNHFIQFMNTYLDKRGPL